MAMAVIRFMFSPREQVGLLVGQLKIIRAKCI
jgi:hypothetical protein